MGHRVSTPRHHGVALGSTVNVAATSMAVLLAVASATSGTATASYSCFVSQQPPYPLQPAATTGSLTPLRATSTAITAASVPPPNSRLGRLRQQSQASPLQRQPPGTKRSQRSGVEGKNNPGGRSTDLRYATSYDSSDIVNSDDAGGESAPWRGFSLRANASVEGERDEDSLAIAEATAASNASLSSMNKPGNHTEDLQNKAAVASRSLRRKRTRMLRFLDRRFARLQLSSPQSSQILDSDSSNSSNSQLDYEQRKAVWAAKYTSVSKLRKSFGKNKNRIWGDFDPSTTRRLYHTLLPRALLELRGLRDGLLANDGKDGVQDAVDGKKPRSKPSSKEDELYDTTNNEGSDEYLQQELKELAPLAYQARLAAKKYARERSRLPGRIGSMLYDGYRSWRRYGKWESSGMTWEQVWNKYEDQVIREVMEELEDCAVEEATKLFNRDGSEEGESCCVTSREELDDEELTARICLRILERSVVTNGAIDRLFLHRLAQDEEERDVTSAECAKEESRKRRKRQERQRRRKLAIQADLRSIEEEFDDDIRELLRYSNLATKEGEDRRSKRKRGAFFWKKNGRGDSKNNDESKADDFPTGSADEDANAPSETDLAATIFAMPDGEGSSNSQRKLAVHEVFALRILATTKQRIASLQALPQLGGGSDGTEARSSSGGAKNAANSHREGNDQ